MLNDSPQQGAKYCIECVCLSVYPLGVRITRKPHSRTSPNFVHVACGRGSVFLWRHCDMLCTSGLADDVTFLHNGPIARHVYSYAAIEYDRHNRRDSNQILLNEKDQHCAQQGKSVINECLVPHCKVAYIQW